jgi:hypothetical protein
MSLTPSMHHRILLAGAALIAGAAVWLPHADAAVRMARNVGSQNVSANWAGYAVTGPDPATGAAVSYTAVAGTWVQPTATCTRGRATYSAFWLGLGGFSEGSQALEQTGTTADCTATGKPNYSVWYELVPAASVPIKLKLAAGDTISAVVLVNGSSVTVRVRNLTRRTVATKRLTMSTAPDVSSAEWVAEAPSSCTSAGRCTILPLTNFGTVSFSQAAVATVDGLSGTISSPSWAATPIELVTNPAAGTGATPGALASGGGSFSVSWLG